MSDVFEWSLERVPIVPPRQTFVGSDWPSVPLGPFEADTRQFFPEVGRPFQALGPWVSTSLVVWYLGS